MNILFLLFIGVFLFEAKGYGVVATDATTVFYAGFNGTAASSPGGAPITNTGTTFQMGGLFFPASTKQSILVNSGLLANDFLEYPVPSKLNLAAGTAEFWIEPTWGSGDIQQRIFFMMGTDLRAPQICVYKDGANNLRFIVGIEDSEAYQAVNLNSWNANSWHHIAVTWSIPGNMMIYIDGKVALEHPTATWDLLAAPPTKFYIGNQAGTMAADALISDFSISSVERTKTDIIQDFAQGQIFTNLVANFFTTKKMFVTWVQQGSITADNFQGKGVEYPGDMVSWASLNPTLAAISTTGLLTAMAAGAATVTAKIGTASVSKIINIASAPKASNVVTYPAGFSANPNSVLATIPVVIIKYLPTSDGINLDLAYGPDFWTSGPMDLGTMENKITIYDKMLRFGLEESTKYRGYKTPAANPSLGYQVVAIYTFYEPTPPSQSFGVKDPNGVLIPQPDMHQILGRISGQAWVESLGVKEFWMWQPTLTTAFPSYDPAIHPPENMREGFESKMSSRLTGDISNSFHWPNDLPLYTKSYKVYGHNLRRTANETIHNRGHQMESEMNYVNQKQDGNTNIMTQSFQGYNAANQKITGRPGNTHCPPNTIVDYDYYNTTPVLSDIEDWTPANTGIKKAVSRDTWGNIPYAWPAGSLDKDAQTNWYVYWFQNMPGFANVIPYQKTNRMTNWWQYLADWEGANRAGLGLYQPSLCTLKLSTINIKAASLAGGLYPVKVTSPSTACRWIATTPNTDWLKINGENTSANGNSVVNIYAYTKSSSTVRRGKVVIGGQIVNVSQ